MAAQKWEKRITGEARETRRLFPREKAGCLHDQPAYFACLETYTARPATADKRSRGKKLLGARETSDRPIETPSGRIVKKKFIKE